ncbi:ABC-type transport system involved in Fe-S cluster assembly, permease component [Desulfosporosinus orientis DSM 765]|uniref:ABC-type transport system involved in Fe-S cluster assembly, permease component n=1 Tax=Desulfosporosinus orientis (strain ATCC 19365 / DSM 765 / NCIMB 8382 / VKM B-1628 / Singapore I) TaxID=768706 RepID=G7WAC1_DESOD|nr:SufD family Fe-S cluster assembly protein [Desulfosporosinus orientis]AET66470.1 ABC-type transport system involved in Fe-S cluster assembly, permease component [Desulfosporosinus orientis DSM 765]
MLNALDKLMLEKVADLHEIPQGAFNIRKNGAGVQRNTTANIDIVTKTDGSGIDVIIKPYTKGESVHIPVIVTEENINDVVYNTFEVGEYSDVLIVAGCGIHNSGHRKSQHDGIHTFYVRKGAKLKYVEKHYGQGDGSGERVLNPKTIIEVEEGAVVELELIQIKGIDQTKRDTEIRLMDNAKLVVTERLLTYKEQEAESNIIVELLGVDSSAQIISRSVAQGDSKQLFNFDLVGRNKGRGHIQCDAIIMHNAQVVSIPRVSAHHSEAQLVHEAAIGRIESEQLIKLMSLGFSEQEAENIILDGFLK